MALDKITNERVFRILPVKQGDSEIIIEELSNFIYSVILNKQELNELIQELQEINNLLV